MWRDDGSPTQDACWGRAQDWTMECFQARQGMVCTYCVPGAKLYNLSNSTATNMKLAGDYRLHKYIPTVEFENICLFVARVEGVWKRPERYFNSLDQQAEPHVREGQLACTWPCTVPYCIGLGGSHFSSMWLTVRNTSEDYLLYLPALVTPEYGVLPFGKRTGCT